MRKKIGFPIAILLSGIFYIFPMQVKRANGEESWNTLSSFTTYFNANDVGRCENIRVFYEIEKSVYKPHQQPVGNAVEIGVDKDRHKRCDGNRAAVLYGAKFENGKRKRHSDANACKRNAFRIVLFFT